jgi:hypothetical protein
VATRGIEKNTFGPGIGGFCKNPLKWMLSNILVRKATKFNTYAYHKANFYIKKSSNNTFQHKLKGAQV